MTQTLNAPAGYTVLLQRVRAIGTAQSTITLLLGTPKRCVRGRHWLEPDSSYRGGGDATRSIDSCSGSRLPAGSAVDVFGPQVEAQAAASVYKTSTTGGVYENCALSGRCLHIHHYRREPPFCHGEHLLCKQSLS